LNDYLDRIVRHKQANRAEPAPELEQRLAAAPEPRPFRTVLGTYRTHVIAECKKASPSRGRLADDYDPVSLAQTYQDAGASAISVLTDDHFFQGSAEDLIAVRAAVTLPVLRKDFLLDEQDLLESRAMGADMVLLIARILPGQELETLIHRAQDLNMDALVEVHSEKEVDQALAAGAELIGINNRDLATFEIDLALTERLMKMVPSAIPVVSESGIFSQPDVLRLRAAGVRAVLVGEALIRADDTAGLLGELVASGCPDCVPVESAPA
jgi:indole-3-glycerol phosphate synthase